MPVQCTERARGVCVKGTAAFSAALEPRGLHRGGGNSARFTRVGGSLDRIVPVAAPRREHGVGILRTSEAAVVSTERAIQIAFLDVDVMAKDDAAEAQVGAHVEEVVIAAAA